MVKFQITLEQFEYEKLLEIITEAYKQGKPQWNMVNSIIEQTKVIYEPKKEGA